MMPQGPMRFRIEGADLNKVYRDLRQAEPKLAAALRKGIKDAAQPVVEEIQHEAEAQGLHRAAAATSVRFASTARRGLTATIRTDHKAAPYARPLEGGSQGNKVNRHPVYGHEWRVDQPLRPYFWSAVDRSSALVGQRIRAALDAVFRR